MHICKPSTQEVVDSRIGYLVNLRPTLISKNCPMFKKEKKKVSEMTQWNHQGWILNLQHRPKRQTKGDTDVTSAAPHAYAHVCAPVHMRTLIHIHKHITQCAEKQKGKKLRMVSLASNPSTQKPEAV